MMAECTVWPVILVKKGPKILSKTLRGFSTTFTIKQIISGMKELENHLITEVKGYQYDPESCGPVSGGTVVDFEHEEGPPIGLLVSEFKYKYVVIYVTDQTDPDIPPVSTKSILDILMALQKNYTFLPDKM